MVSHPPLRSDRARTGKGRIGALQPTACCGCRETLHGPWPDFVGSRGRREYWVDESGGALSIPQRVPVHQTEASHRILRVTRRLGQQLGRPARLEEVAQVLRMRPERLHETVQAFQEPVALEKPVGDG